MEVTVGTAALALALLLLPLLYERCGSFRFFCKMGFYNGWILLLALLAIPLCAVRGRDVENMKIIRGLMQHVKRLYGIRMVVRGTHHFPPRQPYVVVSNHQSSLDLLGMMEVLPDRCVPIAKRELLYMGAVGVVCWLGGIIFIDRKRTHDAISVMAEAAHTMLSQDVRVWVFPEGTRNHSGSMLPFKRGAFHLAVQAQVPVVPIVISSYQHFYSKRERRFTAGRCLIQVLPPLPTLGLSPADVPALTERVRGAMLSAFQRLSAELQGDQSDQQSDHPSDQHSDHQSDHGSDQHSDQQSDHPSDHPSDHGDRQSDHQSDHPSDRGDRQSDPGSDRGAMLSAFQRLSAELQGDQGDRGSDHGSDQHSDHQSDHGDRQSDQQSDHGDRQSDPSSDRGAMLSAFQRLSAELQGDGQSDQQSDQRSDQGDRQSDHQSDHRDSLSDHQSDSGDRQSDPQDTQNDGQSDHKDAQSERLSDHRDRQSDHLSDHRSDHRDRQSDHRSDRLSDLQDRQSDHGSEDKDTQSDLSDHLSDHRDTLSDPHSPTAAQSDHQSDHKDTQSDRQSDHRSDRQRPAVTRSDPSDPWGDPQCPAVAKSDQDDPRSDPQSDPQSDPPSPQ